MKKTRTQPTEKSASKGDKPGIRSESPRSNPVAKHANTYNKACVYSDRKRALKRGDTPKALVKFGIRKDME